MTAPANAEVGSSLYRIMRSLEHCDVDALERVERFITDALAARKSVNCTLCGLTTDAPEGSFLCPIYFGMGGVGAEDHCPVFMDGLTRERFAALMEKLNGS